VSDGADQYFTSKQEGKEKEVFIFKEKFTFVLKTGFEELQVKVYSVSNNEEKEEESFALRLSDQLVTLVDQRDHIK
jgi:hypothetical protein